jgi:hypothetical protein
MDRIGILNNRVVAALVAVGLACCLGVSAWAQNQNLPAKGDPPSQAGNSHNVINGVASECDGVAGNLLLNCGFETGALTNWTQSGDGSFTDVCPNPAVCDGQLVQHTGSFGLRWGPIDPGLGCIAQTVSTTPGASYQFTFWFRDLKVLADPSQRPNNFQIFWNGTKVSGDLVNLPDFDYVQMSMPDLVASGATSTVKVCAFNLPDFFSVDDFVLVAQ